MRWMAFAATAMILGVLQSADGREGCLGCGKPTGCGALSGPACSSPPGYTLSPGCGENTRPCCDNAWAGYCQHRAKMQSFWAQVGTPRPYYTDPSPLWRCFYPRAVTVAPCVQPCPPAAGVPQTAPLPPAVPAAAPVLPPKPTAERK